MFSPEALSALVQVIVVDLVLAGDNAVVIGLAVAGLPAKDRPRIIMLGIAAATLMRIGFAAVTVQLLQIVGLLLAGGLVLLWVAWKLWREIRARRAVHRSPEHEAERAVEDGGSPPRRMRAAIVQIVVADVSLSLDNVLAVAGIARDHMWVLVVGLVLSVVLMGVAASWIARQIERRPWIAYIGLITILYVALEMIVDGAQEIAESAAAAGGP